MLVAAVVVVGLVVDLGDDSGANFSLESCGVKAGFVLTCQSLPVTGQVTVDYDV